MNIDHFDPRKKKDFLQRYDNLFWASRECNGKKSKHWPTPEEKSLGIRFLDCTKELDYGLHIFEDPVTNEVWGATPAGRYHVRIMNLNAAVFLKHRKIRAVLKQALGASIQVKSSRSVVRNFAADVLPFRLLMGTIKQLLVLSIPEIELRQKPVRTLRQE